jgi:hypothetical protein
MIARYALRNRQNDSQRNNPDPNPHDVRNHRILLDSRGSEPLPAYIFHALGLKDLMIFGRHPSGFVRRILRMLADAENQTGHSLIDRISHADQATVLPAVNCGRMSEATADPAPLGHNRQSSRSCPLKGVKHSGRLGRLVIRRLYRAGRRNLESQLLQIGR